MAFVFDLAAQNLDFAVLFLPRTLFTYDVISALTPVPPRAANNKKIKLNLRAQSLNLT